MLLSEAKLLLSTLQSIPSTPDVDLLIDRVSTALADHAHHVANAELALAREQQAEPTLRGGSIIISVRGYAKLALSKLRAGTRLRATILELGGKISKPCKYGGRYVCLPIAKSPLAASGALYAAWEVIEAVLRSFELCGERTASDLVHVEFTLPTEGTVVQKVGNRGDWVVCEQLVVSSPHKAKALRISEAQSLLSAAIAKEVAL